MGFLEEQIENMIRYKESLGFSRRSYACFLMDLARHLTNVEINGVLHIEDIVPWCIQRDTESSEGFRRRITAARELTKYLFAVGKCDQVLTMDLVPVIHRYTPYLFTDAELQMLFRQSDIQKNTSGNPLYKDIVALIFRLIYLCGLRPNEGRELYRNDIDTEKNTLFIRKNKTHKERLIPISEELSMLCQEYLEKRDPLFPESEFMFPAANGKEYSAKWLTRQFLNLWTQACPDKTGCHVRVYDLRHRFATTVLMEWLDQGEDIYTALPYLSAYMGHSDFKDTAYYIHLLPERLTETASIDWFHFQSLIPEVSEDE